MRGIPEFSISSHGSETLECRELDALEELRDGTGSKREGMSREDDGLLDVTRGCGICLVLSDKISLPMLSGDMFSLSFPSSDGGTLVSSDVK